MFNSRLPSWTQIFSFSLVVRSWQLNSHLSCAINIFSHVKLYLRYTISKTIQTSSHGLARLYRNSLLKKGLGEWELAEGTRDPSSAPPTPHVVRSFRNKPDVQNTVNCKGWVAPLPPLLTQTISKALALRSFCYKLSMNSCQPENFISIVFRCFPLSALSQT